MGLVLAPDSEPQMLATSEGPALIAVTTQRFDDSRQTELVADEHEGVPLSVRDSGTVTRTACAAGAGIASGSSPLTIDDRPVIALATSEPLWRDLGPGSKGTDVSALQAELLRLGYNPSTNGVYGASTTAAMKSLQRDVGVINPSGRLVAASVMWLPNPEVTVGSCDLDISETVTNASFATTAATVTSLQMVVPNDPTAVAGDRVVRFNGAQASVGGDGRIVDPAFIAAFVASTEWEFARQSQGVESSTKARVTVENALAEPLNVLTVPPSALYALSDDGACLLGADGPVAVRVLTSTLGRAVVVTEGPAPTQIHAAPVDGALCR